MGSQSSCCVKRGDDKPDQDSGSQKSGKNSQRAQQPPSNGVCSSPPRPPGKPCFSSQDEEMDSRAEVPSESATGSSSVRFVQVDHNTQSADGTTNDHKAEDADEPASKTPTNRTDLRLTRVAAGHGGNSILKDFFGADDDEGGIPGVPDYVIKVYDEKEAKNYAVLQASNDPLTTFCPHFFGEVQSPAPGQNERYMRLSNCLKKFQRGPHVMDCKMGVRSFGEDEVAKSKPRADLYKRLASLYPEAPTDEERASETCTKFRWMSCNDGATTLQQLGFRIDGLAHSGETGTLPKSEISKILSSSDAARCIVDNFLPVPMHPGLESTASSVFLSTHVEDESVVDYDRRSREMRREAVEMTLQRLREMRQAMVDSPFVHTHSFVGCSLLFVADAHGSQTGVFLIDFAKISEVPEAVKIDHSSPWVIGNHEDGLFTGMDNIIGCWEEIRTLI